MERQKITLGNYTYLVDKYEAFKDMFPEYKEFAIIKNSNIMNDVVYDTSVFFIEKDIIDTCLNTDGTVNIEMLSNKIVYPISDVEITSFSSDYQKFNYSFTKESMRYGIDVNAIYSKDYSSIAKIPCDKIRIYLPITNPTLQSIVCVSGYINNVNFYYFCSTLEKYEIQSETEIYDNNCCYSQFYEISIPNISNLFQEGKHYTLENYNIDLFKSSLKHTDENLTVNMYIKVSPKIINYELKNTIELDLTAEHESNFDISFNNNIFKFSQLKIAINKSYLTSKTLSQFITELYDLNKANFINIKIDSKSDGDRYILNIYLVANSTVEFSTGEYVVTYLTPDNYSYFELSDLDVINNSVDNIVIIINGKKYNLDTKWIKTYKNGNVETQIVDLYTLTLPFLIENNVGEHSNVYKKVFINTKETTNASISPNLTICLYPYASLNSETNLYIPNDEYVYNADVFLQNNSFSISAKYAFNDDYATIDTVFNYPNKNSSTLFESYCNTFGITVNDYLNWEEDEDFEFDIETDIDIVGYRLEFALDNSFKQIVYTNEVSIDFSDEESFIDDFQFALNNIFSDWENLPEKLVCRTMFIDKLTNVVLYSNILLMTTEEFKYLINNGKHKLTCFKSLANNILNDPSYMEKINFIDKINCVVNKETTTSSQINKKSSATKIIYKPIFFRVGDLQNIKIRKGLTQNIGINLADLMTKVETFKMLINNMELVEIGRNDVYVLFNINAAELSVTAGYYTIVNQDNEYLSEGVWNIY